MRESILSVLEKNSRIDIRELAIILDCKEIDVANEIAQMEKEGIICGYHTLINWDATSIEKVSALIEVKVTPQRGMGFDKIADRIMQYDEVNALYLMSGAYDFTLLLEGRSMKEVAKSILSTATHFVLKKYKDHGTVIGKERQDERELVN